ncbi:putative cell wall-anchored protein, partial [Staphylococcus simiae CCM 7213 = CCUG 51256]
MKKKSGPINKRVDFISNKLNKYSIRKFTVGTASILISSLMYLGIQNDAQAAENDANNQPENVTAESNSNIKSVDSNSKLQDVKSSENEVRNTSEGTQDTLEKNVETPNTEDNKVEKAVQPENTNVKEAATDSTAEEVKEEKATQPDSTNAKELEADSKAESAKEDKAAQLENKNIEKTEKSSTVESAKVKQAAQVEKSNVEKEKATSNSTKVNKPTLNKNTAVKQAEKKANVESTNTVTPRVAETVNAKKPEGLNVRVRSTRSVDNTPSVPSSNTRNVAEIPPVTLRGKDKFNNYGSVDIQNRPNDLDSPEVTRFNNVGDGTYGLKGAIQLKSPISFDKDFEFNIRVANNHQSVTTGADGWGLLFTKGNGNDYMQKGGILGPKGIENSAGFRIDTGFNSNDPMDKAEKQAGQGFRGYATFVKNGSDGTTSQVGQNIPNKGKADNSFAYADNATDTTDKKFHGQLLNNVKLKYNAATGKIRAEYANKVWEASISDLGLSKDDTYNFLITSSQRLGTVGGNAGQGTHANGWMRTDLAESTFELTPKVENKT